MVGITLSPEQIRSAPPEVRRWLEHELAVSFGLHGREVDAEPASAEHLMVFSPEEAAAVLPLIQGMLPAVNVFFELGRTGESVGRDGIEAFRLTDMMRHTRLQSLEQVIACLQAINEAARHVRQDANASLYFLDRRGYCLIAVETQQSIFRIWQEIVAQNDLQATPVVAAPRMPGDRSASPVFGLSGAVPSSAAHMGGFDPAEVKPPEPNTSSIDIPGQPAMSP